ncbi:hypothetical protein [Kribbella sindirgiensis]|uniref:5'-nucleotidase n=1 Tax=Kribbella sindirgiensis TaxID=1124744 RepID=A0A4V6N3W2_9ACTN|nr:hypothetical protein [Kribbella sindirgiensis]TCC19929.1 hypothetical protein E0H50_37495 [Kribbella sindirgiensis]
MKIGVDIDDVIYPFMDTAHKLCEEAGITNGRQVDAWHMWESYGCTRKEFMAVMDAATLTGELYDALPIESAQWALKDLADAGHEIHLVTARGFGWNHGRLVRYLTERWVKEWQIPHASLTFAQDKAPVALKLGLEMFIDDRVKNYDELDVAGVNVWLLHAPHNENERHGRRFVMSMIGFADVVDREYERKVAA